MPPVDPYQAQDLHLHVSRDTAGSLQLDATLSHDSAKEVTDILVDVRGQGLAVEAIELELTLDAPDFSSRVRVEGSDDLERWFPLNDSAAVAQLRQSGQALVRRHPSAGGASRRSACSQGGCPVASRPNEPEASGVQEPGTGGG